MKKISLFVLTLLKFVGCGEYSAEISQEVSDVKAEPINLVVEESENPQGKKILFNFSKQSTFEWFLVNDDVMGGISRAEVERTNQSTMSFSGRLSLKNNGGFSSVRVSIPRSDLTYYDGLVFKIRGDGRLYSVLVTTQDHRTTWQAGFNTSKEWQIVKVPFDKMRMSVSGWKTNDSPKIIGSKVRGLGFIISDKDEEPFNLEVDWIQAYTDID